MIGWLYENLGNILVLAMLAAAVVLAVRSILRNRKEGKTSCGCSSGNRCSGQCGGCVMSGMCASEEKEDFRKTG